MSGAFHFVDDDDGEGDDLDVDKCMNGSCGRYYGYENHPGLKEWKATGPHACIAPQLCQKCWREGGYPWPEMAA